MHGLIPDRRKSQVLPCTEVKWYSCQTNPLMVTSGRQPATPPDTRRDLDSPPASSHDGCRTHLVFRTEKRRNPITGATYPWIVSSIGVINQFYIYAVDADFGPFFLKFCSYFPYNAKLYQRQRVGQAASHQSRHRLRSIGQRVRLL